MIKIRTISYNFPEIVTDDTYALVRRCINAWNEAPYAVRTQRITLPVQKGKKTVEDYKKIAVFADSVGVRWFNIPFDPEELEDDSLPTTLIKEYEGAFCNLICTKDNQIEEAVIKKITDTIYSVGEINQSGNANFRLGASMNVAPNGPFFPFTYSDGKVLQFSIGLELAEEINAVVSENAYTDLNQLRKLILERLRPQIEEIQSIANRISDTCGVAFAGIDFSLAPLPQDRSSVFTILEGIGITDMNDVGMLFATAFLTDLLKLLASQYKSVGFSGVMYSLLEDKEYAAINDRSGITIDKMISLSTMCGCGVDMVPIDADTPKDAVRTILLEVGCVSSRLHKPLGVRILPLHPDANGFTAIDEDKDFIINTKIVASNANSLAKCGGLYRYFADNC